MTKIITIGDTKFLVLKNEKNEVTNVLKIDEIKDIYIDENSVKFSMKGDERYASAYFEAASGLKKLIFDLLEQK
jgi:hypothetical protein